jgi:signal peptidase I
MSGDDRAPENPAWRIARPQVRRTRVRRAALQWLLVAAVAIGLAVVVRSFAFQAFSIPSASMFPTLRVGDRILVQKLFFNWHDLRTGEIIVFARPAADTMCVVPGESVLVKRVIGLPGQRIYSRGNDVFVDGKELSEPDVVHPLGPTIASKQHPYIVPAGDIYVLGDNRPNSCDSRYWGPIKGSSIIGKVDLLWWRDGHPDIRWL